MIKPGIPHPGAMQPINTSSEMCHTHNQQKTSMLYNDNNLSDTGKNRPAPVNIITQFSMIPNMHISRLPKVRTISLDDFPVGKVLIDEK